MHENIPGGSKVERGSGGRNGDSGRVPAANPRFWRESITGGNLRLTKGGVGGHTKRLISILQRHANPLLVRTFPFSNQKDADGGFQAAKPKSCETGMFYWDVVSI